MAPLGYVTLDEDGYVQEINLAGAKLLSTHRDVITGYPFHEYVAKEDQPILSDLLRKCVGEQRETTAEVWLIAQGGRLIPTQLHSIPVKGPIAAKGSEEGVTFCKVAITDMTEHKNMEEAIRRHHAFLQTVIDALPDSVLVIGRDYRIALANRSARELSGETDMAARCLPCYQVSHHRDLPCTDEGHPCPLRQTLANKAPMTVTHRHYDAQGREVFLEVTAAPVFDEAGEVTHIIEACRDITHRKQAEDALRLTQFSVDHAADAVFWLGPDARFVYANIKACEQLGYSREELLSLTVHDIDPNYPAEGWPQLWEELRQCGSLTLESQHRTKDGRLFPVEITSNYLAFAGKEYSCASVRDISERKRAEESLRQAEQWLTEQYEHQRRG